MTNKKCPHCGKDITHTILLSSLKIKNNNYIKSNCPKCNNEIDIIYPIFTKSEIIVPIGIFIGLIIGSLFVNSIFIKNLNYLIFIAFILLLIYIAIMIIFTKIIK